jgi:uncharacterized protein YydD (DUF2326 family)
MENVDELEQFQRVKKYREQYEEYRLLNNQKNEIEGRMNKVKERVAGMLHEDMINEKIVELSNGEEWTGRYQSQSRSSTNLVALMELVGPKSYGEIVTQKETTFLTIRKAGKEKKENSLINAKPVEDMDKPLIPTGIVLS